MKYGKNSRHVLIIGAGAYGTALQACILSNPNNSVMLLNRKDCLTFQIDLSRFDFVLLAVPSQALREAALWLKEQLDKSTNQLSSRGLTAGSSNVCLDPAVKPRDDTKNTLKIISTAKGIEKNTMLLPHQILEEIFSNHDVSIAVLSGPSFAKEMMAGLPTCVVLASKDEKFLKMASPILHSSYFRIYDSNDILGVEIGGALKNVIAMVAGAVDGLNLGNNARAAVITRGLSEIAEIGVKMGASPLTFMGLSGLGDLILTCTGDLSRNRQFGFRMAKGESKISVLRSLGGVVEGIATTQSAYKLTKKLNIKTSLLMTTYQVLYQNLPISEALETLLNGQQSTEFDWINNGIADC